jgi:L-aspartate oxidase
MGGIRTDEWGRTRILGFYAVGEAACNGIHGANRLASNSLLEGLVFGRRIGRQVQENLDEIKIREGFKPRIRFVKEWVERDIDYLSMKKKLQGIMTLNVGIIRNEESLSEAMEIISGLKSEIEGVKVVHTHHMELINMLTLASLVVKAAILRQESRGAHYRTDYPATDDQNWLKNLVFQAGG